jgi:hypothetical protein
MGNRHLVLDPHPEVQPAPREHFASCPIRAGNFSCIRPRDHGPLHLHQYPGTPGRIRADFEAWCTAGDPNFPIMIRNDIWITSQIDAHIDTGMLH